MNSRREERSSFEGDKNIEDLFDCDQYDEKDKLRNIPGNDKNDPQPGLEVSHSMESIVSERLKDKDSAEKSDLGDLEVDFFEGGEADDGNTANPKANCSMTESIGSVCDEHVRPELPNAPEIAVREETKQENFAGIIRISPSITGPNFEKPPIVAGSNTDASIFENPEASTQEIIKPEDISQSERVHEEIIICEEREVKLPG